MADDTSLPMANPPLAGTTVPPMDNVTARAKAFFAQPTIRKTMPMAAGLIAVAGAGLLYMALASGPQRVLYTSLNDAERAEVAAALDQSGIDYTIDNNTGAMTVGEDDLYRARMLVASDGGLAAPESTAEMLDAIPIGSSRTLEGERLRNVRERELTMTIMEIDGVEAARVHLAQAEKSVFVRESAPPSASVMVRMARGRTLADGQVTAIVSLVSGSVPAMTPDMVRVVDQHGTLLSNRASEAGDGFDMQTGYEEKLRAQIAQLLTPMLGEGNFSSEVQVELDRDDTTSARESYEKDGAVRSETSRESTQNGGAQAGGVPGVLANTPPPATQIGDPDDGGAAENVTGPTSGESSAQRTYELGREVAVSTTQAGGVKRISVAVAINAEAMKKIAPASVAQVQQLVSSAVGANDARGDEVTIIKGTFEATEIEAAPFYETAWFATVLRNSVALIAVILALLFGVRPMIKALSTRGHVDGSAALEISEDAREQALTHNADDIGHNVIPVDQSSLREQVDLAQKLATEQPDRAAEALRRMLATPPALENPA